VNKNKTILWILAVVITLAAAVFQRKTGPNHPKYFSFQSDGQKYKIKLERSHGGDKDLIMKFSITDTSLKAKVHFRKYPSNEDFVAKDMVREGNFLVLTLPHQPPAGKLAYYLEFISKSGAIFIAEDKPAIVRFRGDVPAGIMIPHILIMFVAMLFANVAGLFSIKRVKGYRFYTIWAFILLFIGGGILGPLVQKFAFGEYWTGIPFGWDLTDNKTLIAIIAWLVAVWANWKKERPQYVIFASIITLLIYLIPHSMFGSELNHSSGKIIQA